MARAADVACRRDGRVRACLRPSRSPHSTRPSSSSRRPTSRRTCTSEGLLVFDPLPGGGTPTLTRLRRHLERAPRRAPALSPAALEPHHGRPASGRRGCPTSTSTSPRTSPAPPCPSRAASASCSPGRPTSGRTASTADGRCGASSSSRASPAGAGRWPPRPTIAWWTASGRSTRAPCCSTPSRTRRAVARRGRRRRRSSRTRPGHSAPGRAADHRHRGRGRRRPPPAARRRGARLRAGARRAAAARRARRRAQDEPQRPAQRAPPARRDGGVAGGDQGDQPRAGRHGQRRRAHPRHRRAPRPADRARRDAPGAGLRAMVPVNIRNAAEQLELGNRITSLFVHLPVSVAEPRAALPARAGRDHAAEGSPSGRRQAG